MDHFNLELANCELDTEAFAAYRSRQLQAPKALIVDFTHSQVDVGEDVDDDDHQEKNKKLFVEDLHLVRGQLHVCVEQGAHEPAKGACSYYVAQGAIKILTIFNNSILGE